MIFATLNKAFHTIASALMLALLLAILIYDLIQNYRKQGAWKAIYYGIINFIIASAVIFGFGYFPSWLASFTEKYAFTHYMTVGAIRWIMIYAVLCPFILMMTHKHSGLRGFFTLLWHLNILLVGWLVGSWFGIAFIALPALTLFYWIAYLYAQIAYPASDPENKFEKRQKGWAFIWYLWGLQYPIWVVSSSVTRDIEQIIPGDYFKPIGKPGIVWMHPPQVTAQSDGIAFRRIAGPGIIFTDRYERPTDVLDLRVQLRTSLFDAITEDGIKIKAVLFASFKIDSVDRREEYYELLRKKRISEEIRNSKKVHQSDGSYPYIPDRVRAALSMKAINISIPDINNNKQHWDQIVMQRLQDEARRILAQRTVDTLWTPEQDAPLQSALDEIGAKIKNTMTNRLKPFGVMLIASRVVNFILEDESRIRAQNINTWSHQWQQKTERNLQEGRIAAENSVTQAQAYSKTIFLESIAQSLRDARLVHPDMPKHIVALQFINTLEGLLRGADYRELPEAERQRRQMQFDAWRTAIMGGNQ